MSEEKNDVQTDQPVEQSQPVEPVQATNQEPIEETKEVAKKAPDHNWEEVRKVLQYQKQKIEELESRVSQRPEPKQEEEPDEFASLDPEEYITTGKAKALAEKYAAKKAEQSAKQYVDQYARQQNLNRDEERMRTQFPDYDHIINSYVLPMIQNDPALAHKIQQSKNPAETAYRLGIISDEYKEQSESKQSSEKAEKILKNSSRPVSSAAVGSPLKTQADTFSKMSKNEVWAMSQKFATKAY